MISLLLDSSQASLLSSGPTSFLPETLLPSCSPSAAQAIQAATKHIPINHTLLLPPLLPHPSLCLPSSVTLTVSGFFPSWQVVPVLLPYLLKWRRILPFLTREEEEGKIGSGEGAVGDRE